MASFIKNFLGDNSDKTNDPEVSVIERIELLEKRNHELEESIKLQDKKIGELCKAIDCLQQLAKQESRDESNESKVKQDGHKPSDDNNAPSTLYFSAPTPSGEFCNASTTEQAGTSIYRLVTSDNVHGRFTMIDSKDAICTANLSVSQFVKPVCKIVSAQKGMPQKVTVKEEGTASYEEGVWKVTKKAIIEFA